METGTIKRNIFAVVTTIILVHFSFMIGNRDGYRDGLDSAVKNGIGYADTTYIHDTITQYKPIIEEKVVYEKVYVPVVDTLWKHDTLYVLMDREQLVWQDSLSTIYASGIMPQIDSVQHYVAERVVARELTQIVKKPCRWSVGLHVGYGISVNGGRLFASPYVGAGVSYNLLSW